MVRKRRGLPSLAPSKGQVKNFHRGCKVCVVTQHHYSKPKLIPSCLSSHDESCYRISKTFSNKLQGLKGAPASAFGAELANSSHAHTCVVESNVRADDKLANQLDLAVSGTKTQTLTPNPTSSPLNLKSSNVLSITGQTSYGLIVKDLGNRHFNVENLATGSLVFCRLKGSLRRRVKPGDYVLFEVHDWESENDFHRRMGEVVLQYSAEQARRLMRAGLLPERASDQTSRVEFVQADGAVDEVPAGSKPLGLHRVPYGMHDMMPSSDDDSDDCAPVMARDNGDGELPSVPCQSKCKSRCRSRPAASLIEGIDFHHAIPGVGAGFVAACPFVSIRVTTKFWHAEKGLGYAVPEVALPGGMEVRLNANVVEAAKLKLQRSGGEHLIVTIDSRHAHAYALDAKRA